MTGSASFTVALLDIVGVMNRPQRDEALIKEAGIPLDRALFPLLVGIERFGPIGVVDLADRVGRDYTTVSRQVAKLESLGLVERRGSAADRRVREAVITPKGKAMTDLVDAARERIGRAIFENLGRARNRRTGAPDAQVRRRHERTVGRYINQSRSKSRGQLNRGGSAISDRTVSGISGARRGLQSVEAGKI